MASPVGDDDGDDQHLFAGVRFALVGFDSVSESQYRSEMVRRGGTDAGRFGKGCTHVVACGLVYDDPTCVSARAQGNKVVSELWVDDSLDRGVLADADRVIYWPTRDLNGIPGSESLQICLTGYQRYDREDIMKMVSLMGAQFSKPLLGNIVTHLICYKLEGEKYELAKKLNIKLVNHRWLEDCLRSWEILPVDNYSKSGWELEIMEMQAKDSEDEAEGVDRKPFNGTSSVKRCPNPQNSTVTSANRDVNAPIRSPIIPSGNREMPVERHLNTPGQIRKEDDAVNRTHDIAAQGTPNSSRMAIYSNTDGGAPIQPPFVLSGNREKAAVINLDSPNQIQEAKHKYVGTNTLDTANDVPGTPRSSSMAVAGAANHHFHSSNETLAIPNHSIDNGARKLLDNHGHIDVSKSHLTTLSKQNCSADVFDSSNVDREQHQGYVATCNLVAVAGRSNVDGDLANHEANLKSGGNATPNSIKNLSYSRKTLPRSLSPEGLSVHQITPPQRAEEITLKADSNMSSLEKGNQKNSEIADIRNLKDHEDVKNMDGLGGAFAQKSKDLISLASLTSQNGNVVSETGALNSPSVTRQSDTFEPAIISCVGTNPTEATNVYLRKQPSGSSKSKRSRYRTSFKHGGPVNGVKIPELSAGDRNVESLPKERTSLELEAMTENKCTPSEPAIVQDGKTNTEFSFQNKNDEVAQASSGVNQHGFLSTCEIEDTCGMDRTVDISVHNSRNSQQVSCCGNDDANKTDAPDVNKHEPAVDSNSKIDEVVSDATVKTILNGLPDTSSNVLCEISCPKKATTPRVKAGAKRPHSSSMEVDGSVVNNSKTVVSEPEHEKRVPRQHASVTSKHGSTSASATDCKMTSPKKVPNGGAMKTFSKRQRNLHTTKVNDAQVASSLESSKVISQENIVTDPKKSLGSPNADQHHQNSPKKLPKTRMKNTVLKRSRKSDTNMTGELSVDKAETVHTKVNDAQVASSLESSKVISQENIVTDPKKSLGSANADQHQQISPKKLPKTRVKNTVLKRSRKSDTNMTGELSVDKAETVAAESLFDDLFPSDNVEDCPNKLSSCASADGCVTISPKNTSTSRVRKVVVKRKIEAVKNRSASKHEKIASAIVSAAKAFSSKRMEESACNISEVTADQDSRKGGKDGMGDVSEMLCKDTINVEKSEGLHNSKSRCSKRNKSLASDHNKENRQENGDLSCKSNGGTGSLNSKLSGNSMHNSTDMLDEHMRIKGNGAGTLITLDPAWFILSGQRQQRRDYRSILRRLKGRVCRDSHNWSYKATHFIAPNPLRRTEKFFAAAAAGRWILKSDYLTSCNEAGKFLDEEPFEWSGKGLNDIETISYEAPRKWRVLRQQVGHGAFYGMQIIVYGQLISPSLDTVKRAVQAGDGTILATSPPYTRFLNTGVDFAVISASMPSADAWVQEFMSHDIPCVSADYLVEYVCKPGYPLDRHVLFKTNRLAKKSLDKLLKNQREVATHKLKDSEDGDTDNLSCSVCGQTDRGEVMLICGDEKGAAGCGTGMHIDCSDPPLEAVPDDDWLCPKCDVSKGKKKPTRSTGSKSRVSKQRT